jgi:hypothetical protein
MDKINRHLIWFFVLGILYPLSALVMATGHYGGTLVYGLDHYSW